jgi:hypothetical protein
MNLCMASTGGPLTAEQKGDAEIYEETCRFIEIKQPIAAPVTDAGPA